MKQVTLYCDGACISNPGGDGGWAVKLFYKNSYKELYDGPISDATNQRMEILALIKGLEALSESCEVHVYTDSKYLRDGVHKWSENWKKKGWKNFRGQPVANQDLWKHVLGLVERHCLTVHWVRGHNGDRHNERVDWLARCAAGRLTEE